MQIFTLAWFLNISGRENKVKKSPLIARRILLLNKLLNKFLNSPLQGRGIVECVKIFSPEFVA